MADTETNTAEMIDLGDQEEEQQTEAAEEEAEIVTSNPNDQDENEEEAKENQSSDLQSLKADLEKHKADWEHLDEKKNPHHGVKGFVKIQSTDNDLGEFGVGTDGISMPNLKKCCNPDVRVRFARYSLSIYGEIRYRY